MTTRRSSGQLNWIGLGAWLLMALGCTPTPPTATTPAQGEAPRPAAAVEVSVPPAAPVEPGPDDPDAVPLSSGIRKVTVYSDRALVTREASARITAEATVYAFHQLPGWVDDSSVRVSASAGRILDVRVARSYLALATDQVYRQAEEEARALANRLGALDDELMVLEAQAKQIEDIKAFSLEKLNKDVVVGNVGVGSYQSVIEFVSRARRETAQARRAVQIEREKLVPDIEASARRIEDLKGLRQLEQTTVYVTLQGTAPAESLIAVSYMLPGATWEPLHDVRVPEADPTQVEVTSFAVVTQASGEDWSGAELTFSTQSSSAAVRIPELEALTLGDTRAATQILERQSASFTRAQEAFQGQNRLWNQRLQASSLRSDFEAAYETNFEYLRVVQSKTVPIFQSLQQRGTTAQFRALATANVRADGRSVRVPIGRADLKAEQAIVAAPEQSLNAARILNLRNESGQPLLPGNVALYQAGAFLGMTSLDFVADGEQFSLFLSVADQLKLSRTLDRKRSALVRKERTLMQLAFLVKVENLSAAPMTLTLADRIPVSEDRDIVVSGVKVTPDAKPDSKGILRWPLTLAAKETRTFEIRYQIEYPPTLVLEMRRGAVPPPSPAAAPSELLDPARPYDLRKDIEQMERVF